MAEAPELKVQLKIENDFDTHQSDIVGTLNGETFYHQRFQFAIEKAGVIQALHILQAKGFGFVDAVGYLESQEGIDEMSAFRGKVVAERATHALKGYSAEHDAEQGIEHLLVVALGYLYKGKSVEGASMVLAVLDLIQSQHQASEPTA